ncbi:class I adenylate-forming enzyme family protein [Aquicoccus sp. G2-2]|uniref:class I adenylate-forming enzyme family protein n=1 Tax=Aquicoccus sp. G2-2 TaxID=3092120 RepID=UPI002AE043BB|nr:AMP-binding protein [Aquicoccus sp. G2-2]MEA1113406.1 AMP-binding protein [Aquicoccus sp. G2-2]
MRLHDMLSAAAQAKGSALAIIDHDGQRFSWADMRAGAEAARAALEQRGISEGARVVIVLENSAAMLAWLYGITLAGAIACPVNARLTGAELNYILEHSEAAAVVCTIETGTAPQAHAERLQAERIDGPVGAVALATWAGGAALEMAQDDAQRVAILLYTSGTTGRPKGAMLSHANLCASAAASRDSRDLMAADLVYLALPVSHVFGLATILAVTLTQAAAWLEARFDVARLHAALNREVTVFPAVPQMHAQLFQYARERGHRRYEGRALRYVSSGGAPLDPAWKREAEAFYGVALQNGYGLTESSSGVCMTRNALGDPDVSVGVPMRDALLRVELGAPGADRAAGIGEVEIAGPQVMLGYFRAPEQTAQVMTADGWLRSGDLGRIDAAGRLHLVGRSKELIIHSGFNVYPAEVEAALTEHDAVVLAAVIGRAAQGNEEVLAFVTLAPGAVTSEAELREFLRARLAPYKVPARIVIADALPAAPTGKILKAQLLKHFAIALL